MVIYQNYSVSVTFVFLFKSGSGRSVGQSIQRIVDIVYCLCSVLSIWCTVDVTCHRFGVGTVDTLTRRWNVFDTATVDVVTVDIMNQTLVKFTYVYLLQIIS